MKDFKNRGGLIRREDVKEMSTQHNFFLTIMVARLRLESGVGEARLALLDRPDVALHRVVAACITPVLESIHDPGRLVVILLQIVLDRLNMGREDRFPRLTLAVMRKLVAQEMLLDRLAMTTRLLGDRPDALAVPVHGLDFYKYLLGDHWVSPPFVEETIPWVQSPGGTLFVPIIGTLFHAHRHRVLPIRFDLQLRGQRAEDRSVPVPHLGQPIANLAGRGPKHTTIALVPVADASARAVFFFGLLLQGLEKRDKEVPHDLVTVALEPTKQAIELEIVFWYLIGDGDLDFEVVHWATPPSVVVNIMEGCSPSFLPLSNAIT